MLQMRGGGAILQACGCYILGAPAPGVYKSIQSQAYRAVFTGARLLHVLLLSACLDHIRKRGSVQQASGMADRIEGLFIPRGSWPRRRRTSLGKWHISKDLGSPVPYEKFTAADIVHPQCSHAVDYTIAL